MAQKAKPKSKRLDLNRSKQDTNVKFDRRSNGKKV